MRKNSYGYGIKSFGNRADVDFLIVHVQRGDNPYGKDINGAIKPDGTMQWTKDLDGARAWVHTVYHKNKSKLHKDYEQIVKKNIILVRNGHITF